MLVFRILFPELDESIDAVLHRIASKYEVFGFLCSALVGGLTSAHCPHYIVEISVGLLDEIVLCHVGRVYLLFKDVLLQTKDVVQDVLAPLDVAHVELVSLLVLH